MGFYRHGWVVGDCGSAALAEQASANRDLASTQPDSAQRLYQANLNYAANNADYSGMMGDSRAGGLTLSPAAAGATDEVVAAAMASQAREREAQTMPLLFSNTLADGGGVGISSDRQRALANARSGGANFSWGSRAEMGYATDAELVKAKVVAPKTPATSRAATVDFEQAMREMYGGALGSYISSPTTRVAGGSVTAGVTQAEDKDFIGRGKERLQNSLIEYGARSHGVEEKLAVLGYGLSTFLPDSVGWAIVDIAGGAVIGKGVKLAVREFPVLGKSVGELLGGGANGGPSVRPTWHQSEIDVGAQLKGQGYKPQISFKDGVEVPYGTKGSVRPEYYREGSSVEVKNYKLETAAGRASLESNVVGQAVQRADNLPSGTVQALTIDARGQNITRDQLHQMLVNIERRSGGAITRDNVNILR